jgi:hypothetical protein
MQAASSSIQHSQPDALQRLARFVEFYNQLNFSNLDTLTELYGDNVEFIDPVHQISGLAALEQYFAHAYQNLQHCEFVMGAHGVGPHWGFVSWQMRFRHPAIGAGELIVVDGSTELTYNEAGKIIRHRDYYDLTQMVYQHLPVIGWLTGKVRNRMAQG